MYEARCRRCFEPNLTHEKVATEKESADKFRAAAS
jgi:hypothetical protein